MVLQPVTAPVIACDVKIRKKDRSEVSFPENIVMIRMEQG